MSFFIKHDFESRLFWKKDKNYYHYQLLHSKIEVVTKTESCQQFYSNFKIIILKLVEPL